MPNGAVQDHTVLRDNGTRSAVRNAIPRRDIGLMLQSSPVLWRFRVRGTTNMDGSKPLEDRMKSIGKALRHAYCEERKLAQPRGGEQSGLYLFPTLGIMSEIPRATQ